MLPRKRYRLTWSSRSCIRIPFSGQLPSCLVAVRLRSRRLGGIYCHCENLFLSNPLKNKQGVRNKIHSFFHLSCRDGINIHRDYQRETYHFLLFPISQTKTSIPISQNLFPFLIYVHLRIEFFLLSVTIKSCNPVCIIFCLAPLRLGGTPS